jgi:pimeloyl-ACP methyl ester carboxylesterase
MTELYVAHSGPTDPDHPVVLWVHGLDSDGHCWDRPIELVAATIECASIDLPGHGVSPAPDGEAAYERAAVLDDIDAVIANLRAVNVDRPIVWVGHSLGGYLGMAHVLTRSNTATSINGLVLVSTGPGFRDPDAMQSWNDRVRKNSAAYSVSQDTSTIAFHSDSMVMDGLGEISLPIALVVGDGDRAFLGANDYLEKKLPHATRLTVEGARHFVMKSHPEAVANAVELVLGELG